MSKLVAIGDIHAYGEKLDDLLGQLESIVDFSEDRLIFIGDYVDGGPNAKQVVQKLIDLQEQYPHWVFLMGNHEHMMLDALSGSRIYGGMWQWWQQGGMQTYKSYRPDTMYTLYDDPSPRILLNQIPRDHLEWMKELDTLYETEHFVFVHAGLVPGKEPEETPLWERLWLRRMFIDSDYDWGKRVIYGHTVTRDFFPLVHPNKIGIDTMHHGHGKITALILDESYPEWYDYVQSKD